MIDLSKDERVRAFAFDGGPAGVLLLHGFTGTPAEFRGLGSRLAALGFAVRAPLLPGHGTNVEDLAGTRWEDWYATAESAWRDLGTVASRRAVVGLSMGGLLALHLAHEHSPEVRAAVALAPALELTSQRSAEIARWVRRLPRLGRRFEIVAKSNSGRLTPAYDEIPLRALASMLDLQRRVKAEIPAIRTPVLLAEGGRDETVAGRAIVWIESAIGSVRRSRLVLPNSGHILTEDVEKDTLFEAVSRFLLAETTDG